jgi:hypothetical protein
VSFIRRHQASTHLLLPPLPLPLLLLALPLLPLHLLDLPPQRRIVEHGLISDLFLPLDRQHGVFPDLGGEVERVVGGLDGLEFFRGGADLSGGVGRRVVYVFVVVVVVTVEVAGS